MFLQFSDLLYPHKLGCNHLTKEIEGKLKGQITIILDIPWCACACNSEYHTCDIRYYTCNLRVPVPTPPQGETEARELKTAEQ